MASPALKVKVFSVADFVMTTEKLERLESATDALHIPLTSIVWWKHPRRE